MNDRDRIWSYVMATVNREGKLLVFLANQSDLGWMGFETAARFHLFARDFYYKQGVTWEDCYLGSFSSKEKAMEHPATKKAVFALVLEKVGTRLVVAAEKFLDEDGVTVRGWRLPKGTQQAGQESLELD